MPTPLTQMSDPWRSGLELLRTGSNPFTSSVASVSTADQNLSYGVANYTASQLAEIVEIIGTYRDGGQPTRVYPVVGDRGSGKTHLLYALRANLLKQATDTSEETMLVVVDHLSTGLDPIEYLLWQIVNFLMAHKGEGERVLGVIAGRLTSRLLAESLRRMTPPRRIELIPPSGFWDRLRLGMGSVSRSRSRNEAIEGLAQKCDTATVLPAELRQACESAQLPFQVAVRTIEEHLERSESKDVPGWFRKRLYLSLAKFAILEDREAFESLHEGEYEEIPAHVSNAGNLSHRLLEVWLELLTTLRVPVVVVFDQLEDYLRSHDPTEQKAKRQFFSDATTKFINALKHLCIFIFTEEAFWIDFVNDLDDYAKERLRQTFSLPGRAAKHEIKMPSSISSEVAVGLIRQRLRLNSPDLAELAIEDRFPFTESDIAQFTKTTSIRDCLRKIGKRFDEIVFPVKPPEKDLRQQLLDLWNEAVTSASNRHGSEMKFQVAFIPEVQNAFQAWLDALKKYAVGSATAWHKVELVTDDTKQQYGSINVIRIAGPKSPGIGIAAWLGQKKAHSHGVHAPKGV
jgi:hypothetical protein